MSETLTATALAPTMAGEAWAKEKWTSSTMLSAETSTAMPGGNDRAAASSPMPTMTPSEAPAAHRPAIQAVRASSDGTGRGR